ncbi:uncharacterized protein F5147DRAFT_693678 [Suillus discolor]|uniref:WW domain-containing protein n=1 Tax=Suillus discolor TaxID=1912936 RepID=A0A9P7F7K6_9AGAM|nr:uncharacterized protein F5147DRAFT_693678 [Suillus discolor]KAG2109024.1 hypothetical protein F5147DRAFT_693678 [Suillus discolor]
MSTSRSASPTEEEVQEQVEQHTEVTPKSTGESTSPEESAEPSDTDQDATTAHAFPTAGSWQAIWSPQHNAYYFYNSETKETTWVNPLQPAASEPEPSSSSTSQSGPSTIIDSHYATLQANAMAQGIDPSLAHLDPSLASSSGVPSNLMYTAKFNARTGAFAKVDSRDPTHLSEYERAKRMSEFYFDVGAWESDVEARNRAEIEAEGEGKKRKRPTKKDLVRSDMDSVHYRMLIFILQERFKEQKKLKKIAKTAWLRT